MDNIQITTVVSLDCDTEEPMRVIHLVQGDYGTRALRLVPVHNSQLVHMEDAGYVQAKVRLACAGQEDLLIDCQLNDTSATLVPTQAMVSGPDEWTAQLVLYTEDNETLSTQPFRLKVHGTVYEGDAVEHTSSRILSVAFDAQGRLCIEIDDGTSLVTAQSVQQAHTHGEATGDTAGFMSAEDKTFLDGLSNQFDQGVKTTDSPTFAGITIGNLTIDGQGNISGARFT